MESTPSSRLRLFWQLQISSWLVLIPFFAGIAMFIFDDISTSLFVGVSRQIIGFALTLGFWKIYRRWPPAQFQLRRHAWQILLCCLAATVLDVVIAESFLRAFLLTDIPVIAQYGSAVVRLAIYLAWSAFYIVIRQEMTNRETELRLARAEFANREAELQLLRAQMNPHFLFNALNTIIGEAEQNPAAVIDTTHAVADYLRYSLNQNGHQAPLGEELIAMSNYLRVERSNYGAHRFDWSIDATDEARCALAPTALVQPLIENAIKYGLSSSGTPLQLRVTGRVESGQLKIAVENSGEWRARKSGEDPAHNSHGIGLNNLQRRLNLLYGQAARFEVTTPPGFVCVTISVPYVVAPAKSAAGTAPTNNTAAASLGALSHNPFVASPLTASTPVPNGPGSA